LFCFPVKYCSLIDKEGGLQLLEDLIDGNVRPLPYPEILKLANIVRNNVANWKKIHATSSLTDDDVMNDDGPLVLDG
jgi:hypothetical protein